ncbi:FixH family protein [Mesorhizobium sp. M0701]|uniref:FixH family protein n=1 Tax=Mesorhizobium sp. M0701 TaxID=2956989 RepID=UPI0033353C26
MPALILAFFATIIIVELTMAVLASRSWAGFKNSHVDSQEFNRKAGEGGRARMEQPFAIANGEIRCRLRPERQDAQAGGVKRMMMTGLAAATLS